LAKTGSPEIEAHARVKQSPKWNRRRSLKILPLAAGLAYYLWA
jgi:hypothetical protein